MNDLIARLRGTYTVLVQDGAGPLDGKDSFAREFITAPIQHEAANRIEELQLENLKLRRIAAHVPAKIYIKAKEKAGYGESVRTKVEHSPDCDVNDFNLEGIKKPCNCQ